MKLSAGLLVYRIRDDQVEVLLAHPGGPFWEKKDLGAWSIPKGEYDEDKDPIKAAKREFTEEIGQLPPGGKLLELGTTKRNNKQIMAWAVEGDLDASSIKSITFSMEWPPKSANIQEFPEIDRAGWFSLSEAARKLSPGQVPFIERLTEHLGQGLPAEHPQSKPHQGSLF